MRERTPLEDDRSSFSHSFIKAAAARMREVSSIIVKLGNLSSSLTFLLGEEPTILTRMFR
jgi:hypothetical protein